MPVMQITWPSKSKSTPEQREEGKRERAHNRKCFYSEFVIYCNLPQKNGCSPELPEEEEEEEEEENYFRVCLVNIYIYIYREREITILPWDFCFCFVRYIFIYIYI